MRDYINPLLLLVIVVLLALRVSGAGDVAVYDMWLLVLCVTALLVNGALMVARSISRRRALMSAVWSVVYLLLGSCTWVLCEDESVADEELAAYRALEEAWQQGSGAFTADENGDSFFVVAASVGRSRVLREILAEGSVPKDQLAEAARRAAENGRVEVLKLLIGAGVPVDAAVGSTTLLCSAAQNGQFGTTELLLQGGAGANVADSDGMPPLIHAVLADSAPVVRVLLQAGADPAYADAQGRTAADYSRSTRVDELLGRP